MERVIEFADARGRTLHGILHMPEARAHTSLGVMLMSPGQKCRLGPWRAYVLIARKLCELGVPVLRFDFHGLGDSDGEHEHGQFLVDFNGYVQTGGLSPDVKSAAAFFAREAGVRKLVFAGLCGGAATGLQAGADMPEVYGHVLVDLPVTVSNSARQRFLENNAAELLKLRPEESHGVLRGYLSRVTDPGAWKRLLTGGSDYKLLVEAAKRVALQTATRGASKLPATLRERIPALAPKPAAAAPAAQPAAPSATGSEEILNQPTIDAFLAARRRGQKLFFLNSSAYHPTFQQYFGATHVPASMPDGEGMGLLVVPECNHVFSQDHAQRALMETVEEFVRNAVADFAERPSAVSLSPAQTVAASSR